MRSFQRRSVLAILYNFQELKNEKFYPIARNDEKDAKQTPVIKTNFLPDD